MVRPKRVVVRRRPTVRPAITSERLLCNAAFSRQKLNEWAKLGSARVGRNDRNWVLSHFFAEGLALIVDVLLADSPVQSPDASSLLKFQRE